MIRYSIFGLMSRANVPMALNTEDENPANAEGWRIHPSLCNPVWMQKWK
jgi:hypothetical protein